MSNQALVFPVTDSEDVVSLSSLPADANEILELLRMELVPLKLWRAVAMEYIRANDFDNAEIILRAGCDREVQSVPVYAQETSDQVALFNTLAAFLSQQAAFGGKPHVLGEARELHERGSLLDMLNQFTWVGKGHTLLCNFIASGGPDLLAQAVKQFQIAIDDPTGVCAPIAHLGKAHALLLQKNFKQALDEYRYVLRHDGSQNQARLGIGVCQFGLGRPAKAVEAFKRALAVDPNSVEAMAGLASQMDVELIARTLAVDASSPVAIALAALHLLLDQSESVKAETLARRRLSLTVSGEVGNFLNLVLAAAIHMQGRFDEAYRTYISVIGEGKGGCVPLARLGAAQCCIALGQEAEAVGLVTSENKPRYPESPECMRIWAYLNAKNIRKDIGRRFHSGRAPVSSIGPKVALIDAAIDRVIRERPGTAEEMLIVKTGLALDCVQNQQDCQSVLTMLDQLDQTDGRVRFNKAVLLMNSGKPDDARVLVEGLAGVDPMILKYTEGLLEESSSNTGVAASIYTKIVNELEAGNSCSIVWGLSKIRLALIAEQSKTPEEILPMYEVPLDEEGKQQISDGIDLVLLAKAMYLERHNDLEQAIKTVATVPALKHDQFSNTFVANLFLKRAVQEGAAGYAKEEEKLLDSAMKFFQRALETSQCSFQSVLGVACVLAHRNRKWQALELLKSLADVKGGRPEDDAAVQINLGHLAMESAAADSDASKRAAKCYEAALRLLGDHPSVEQVKLFLAAAYFTSDRFEEALELLPSDSENPVVKFDRAVLLENHAAKILMDKQKAQSVDLVRKAIDMLAEAVAIFESFNKVEVSKGGFGTCVKAKLAEHIDYCRNTVPQAENWFAVRRAQIEEEKLRKQQLEQARKEREEIERQRLLEQQAREQEEAEQLAAQAEQRMQDIKESLAAAMVEDAEGPDGKKKRKKVTGEKGETKTKRKRGRAKKKSDSSSDSSSSSSSSSSGSSSDSDSSSSSGSSSSSSSGSSSSSSTSKSSGPVARPKHDTTMEDLFGEEAL